MSAEVDASARSETKLLVDKVDVVCSALRRHRHAADATALTTATLCNN